MGSPRVVSLTIALLVALNCRGREPLKNLETQTLSTHADIGPFIVTWGMSPPDKEKIMSQVRSFFWEHLQNRAPGQIQVTFANVEGGATRHTFSIQTDKKGNTVVRDQIVETVGGLPGEARKHKKYVQRFCAFVRLSNDSQEPVPQDQGKPPESFKLRLKDCQNGPDLVL